MSVEYHPAVEQDVAEALRRYDAASPRLAVAFQAELRQVIAVAAAATRVNRTAQPGSSLLKCSCAPRSDIRQPA